MKIVNEVSKVKNYPIIPAGEVSMETAIERATTHGLWLMIENILSQTKNGNVKPTVLLRTPEGKQLKDQLTAGLTALMNNL